MTLTEIVEKLSRNFVFVEIKTGISDVINGYGWHTVYFVNAKAMIEYCPHCRNKTGMNYSDYGHFGNHRHEKEFNNILQKECHSERELCDELLKILDQ